MIEERIGQHACGLEDRYRGVRLVDPGREESDVWVVGNEEIRSMMQQVEGEDSAGAVGGDGDMFYI